MWSRIPAWTDRADEFLEASAQSRSNTQTPRCELPATLQRAIQPGKALHFSPAERHGFSPPFTLWRLDPDSRMAKQACRYPITESGIENLVNRVYEFYAARDDWSSAVNCSVSKSSETNDFVMEYCLKFRDRSVSPEYLESRLSFDEATGLLIVVRNFGWTNGESPRIVEHYAYRAIDQAAALSDTDFDEKNSEYEFVAR